MTSYDAWKTTDRAAELNEALHATFERSDEFMSAYVDYCDEFVGSSTYERAFEQFIDIEGEVDDEDETGIGRDFDAFDEELAESATDYYGLHPEDEADIEDEEDL